MYHFTYNSDIKYLMLQKYDDRQQWLAQQLAAEVAVAQLGSWAFGQQTNKARE